MRGWTARISTAFLLSGCFALFADADVGREADFYFGKLEAYLREFEAVEARAKPLMEELSAMRERYRRAEEPEALAKKRRAIRSALAECSEEIEGIKRSFRSSQNLINITVFAAGVRENVGDAPSGRTSEMSRRLVGYDLSFSRMTKFQVKIRKLLHEDGIEARRLEIAIERRKTVRMVLAGVAALFFPVLGAILWMNRGRITEAAAPGEVSPEAPAAGPAPEELSGFRLLREIGRGARGTVYEALDVELDRRVAVKRMAPGALEEAQGTQRFLNEARMAASLKHPNIAEIYSIRQEPSGIYLVFEYVAGRSLRDILDERERLPFKEAARILEGIGRALDFAHGQGIVHRDLQPKNVIVAAQGEAKVTNFGLAYQSKDDEPRRTRASGGTGPAYSAPEQEQGRVSKSSDLFSLGVCAYEVLTGQLPFRGPNYLAQKAEGLYAPASSVAGGLPAGADGFFRRALAAEPRGRFATAEEFLAAFSAAFRA